LKKTDWFTAGDVGEEVNFAVGNVAAPPADTVTGVPVDVADKPMTSVTVNCTV